MGAPLQRSNPAAGDQVDVLLVLEQSLGHVVHGRNVERALAGRSDIGGRVVRIEHGLSGPRYPVPGLRSWSLEASLLARRQLRRHLAERRPDAILIHTQVASLLAGPIMRVVPTVVSMDATPVRYDSLAVGYGHRVQSAPFEAAKWRLNRRALLASGAVVAWSRWAAESVIDDYRLPAEKVRVIRPGVDLRRFAPGPGHDRGPTVRLLFVGGDFERKGGAELLRALAAVGADVEADIVTSAPGPTLPVEVASRVRVHTGLVHGTGALEDLYQRADVFVVPSKGECYGMVYAEAMASGLPIVACDVGAVSELVAHGDNGLLVPPGDTRALAAALRLLAADPDLRRGMGERGRQRACREHHAERNCGELLELMIGLVREHGSRRGVGAG